MPTEGDADPLYDLQLILWDLAQSHHLAESQRFAGLVQQELNQALALRDRGVKQAPFRVLVGAAMPAVLVELGFLSNPEEEKKLGEADLPRRAGRGAGAGDRPLQGVGRADRAARGAGRPRRRTRPARSARKAAGAAAAMNRRAAGLVLAIALLVVAGGLVWWWARGRDGEIAGAEGPPPGGTGKRMTLEPSSTSPARRAGWSPSGGASRRPTCRRTRCGRWCAPRSSGRRTTRWRAPSRRT